VRLTEHQVEVIVRAVKSCFGDGACTYLFGSRLDDAMKGAILICLSDIRGWPISPYFKRHLLEGFCWRHSRHSYPVNVECDGHEDRIRFLERKVASFFPMTWRRLEKNMSPIFQFSVGRIKAPKVKSEMMALNQSSYDV